jgi:hypothetical protein
VRSLQMEQGLLTAVLVLVLAGIAAGHHILGIPHYAYDESYPQAPVITYAVEAGPYLVKVTGYPGKPAPGELAQVHAYVTRLDDPSAIYGGAIAARLERDGLLGTSVVWGPSQTRFEENLHKLSPRFGDEGRYRLRLELELEGQPYEIDFPLVVGQPASTSATLLGWGAAMALLVVVVRAARIKLERRRTAAAARS